MQRQRSVLSGIFGFIALVALMLVANPTQAASGNGPYYAEPSWSQKLPAATRFVVLTDWNSEAVLDRETGLVWEVAPQTGDATWEGARFVCANKIVGNRKGWRLPSIHEQASLIDPSIAFPGPNLPTGHPFTNVRTFYWSATTNAEHPDLAFGVNFFNGVVSDASKTLSNRGWCVRGGMNAERY